MEANQTSRQGALAHLAVRFGIERFRRAGKRPRFGLERFPSLAVNDVRVDRPAHPLAVDLELDPHSHTVAARAFLFFCGCRIARGDAGILERLEELLGFDVGRKEGLVLLPALRDEHVFDRALEYVVDVLLERGGRDRHGPLLPVDFRVRKLLFGRALSVFATSRLLGIRGSILREWRGGEREHEERARKKQTAVSRDGLRGGDRPHVSISLRRPW